MFAFKTVSLSELRTICRRIAGEIKSRSFYPDHILYIERAGKLIAFYLANEFGCNYSGVQVLKNKRKLRERLNFFIKLLPPFFRDLLRLAQKLHRENLKDRRRFVYIDNIEELLNKKILIVDDAVDTGESMRAIKAKLLQEGFRNEDLQTAVITIVNSKKTQFKPDIYIFHDVCCKFPWSVDSSEFDMYQRIVNNLDNYGCLNEIHEK